MKKAISKQTMMLGTEQKNKKLQSFRVSGKFLIPKSCFLDFMVSESSFDIKRKTINIFLWLGLFLKIVQRNKLRI